MLGLDLRDDDNPRKATGQLLDGPGQPAGAVLRAALRDFIEPESAGEDDETVATFGSTTGMRDVGLRELPFYIEGPNTRFVTLTVMG
jgi:hypothetical protein